MEPEDMVREVESVDGQAYSCTLTPETQRILQGCFKDLVSNIVCVDQAHKPDQHDCVCVTSYYKD